MPLARADFRKKIRATFSSAKSGIRPASGGQSGPSVCDLKRPEIAAGTRSRGMDELLTATELAERLRVRPETVRQWARDGRIPRVKVNAKITRYDVADVIRALKGREEGAQAR
jgi:excisionase family DNA binding protein